MKNIIKRIFRLSARRKNRLYNFDFDSEYLKKNSSGYLVVTKMIQKFK